MSVTIFAEDSQSLKKIINFAIYNAQALTPTC